MNAEAFRHFYEYHFAENRRLWAHVSSLPQEQFTRDAAYSLGSVRDQLLHLIWADDLWFSQLRGIALPAPPDPAGFGDRTTVRARWDEVEQRMRDYLAALLAEMLFDKRFPDPPEHKELALWL